MRYICSTCLILLAAFLIAAAPLPPDGQGIGFLQYPAADSPKTKQNLTGLATRLSSIRGGKLIITATMKKSYACGAKGHYDWLQLLPEHLPAILEAAAKAGVDVYIGLVDTYTICRQQGKSFTNSENRVATAFLSQKIARALEEMLTLAGTTQALRGWYLPDPAPAVATVEAVAYYKTLATAIHAVSLRPILLQARGNHLRSSGSATLAASIANSAQRYRQSGIDLQLWEAPGALNGALNGMARGDLSFRRLASPPYLPTFSALTLKLPATVFWILQ